MKNATLKPCPFCGGVPRHVRVDDEEDDPRAGGEYIECSSCGASTSLVFPVFGDDASERAIGKWNKRIPQTSI